MLKLPGRGKEKVNKSSSLTYYRDLFHIVKEKKKTTKIIQNDVVLLEDRSGKIKGSIELQNITLTFGKHEVLKNVNIKIKPGEIFGVIGESGSGKTSILRLLVGFYHPTTGEVLFNNKSIKKQISLVRRNFGFASQDKSFYNDLNVEENIKYFGRMYGLKKDFLETNVERVLHLVKLDDARKVLGRHLSGGMQRRLDFACALIHDPSVLILDEPTEDLDPHLRNEILRFIKDLNKKGKTIVFTTHLMHEAEYLCDEVAILKEGRVLVIGTPDDLRKTYKSGSEIHLVLQGNNYTHYVKKLKNMNVKTLSNKLIVSIPPHLNAVKILKELLTLAEHNRDEIICADIKKPTLSEVFATLTKYGKNKTKGKRRK